MRAPHLLGITAVCAVTAFGCNRPDKQIDTQQVRQEAREAAVVAGDRIADGWLATKIQAQFFADNDIRARDISVTADEGIVTLSGHVPDENAHTQAVQMANNTDGVNRVIDHLVVGPPATPASSTGSTPGAVATAGAVMDDARVTSTIQSKYFLDDLVKGRRIDVDTRNRVVTLRGEVESEAERDRALQLARSTEGVQRVEDSLTIMPPAAPAAGPAPEPTPDVTQAVDDATVTTKIQAKFFLDRDVKAGGIDVKASGGVVTLEGTAPSAAVRDRAVQIARETAGVTQVIDRIAVGATR